MMKTDIYACSKPLQYFNARNIPRTFHSDHRRILVIITYFYKADDFYENIKANDDQWDKVVKVSNKIAFYLYLLFHRFDSLIYGYDTSTALGVIHTFKKYGLYILEEGTGTYMPNISKDRKNIFQRVIDKMTGVSTEWGHTKFVKGAFVYYPDLYTKLRRPNFDPTGFEKPFIDKIAEDKSLFVTLSEAVDDQLLSIKESKILLYITSWDVKPEIIDKMKIETDNYDYAIIKPHPHITNYTKIEEIDIKIVKSNIMVEFLLGLWIAQKNKITVYHVGSTAIFYFRDFVEAIDLSLSCGDTYHKLIRGEV